MTSKCPSIPRTDFGRPRSGQNELCSTLNHLASAFRCSKQANHDAETWAAQLVPLESQKTVLTVSDSTFQPQYRLYESSHQVQSGLGGWDLFPSSTFRQRTPSSSWHPAHAFRSHLSRPTPEKRKIWLVYAQIMC